jgi:hypothetical protein
MDNIIEPDETFNFSNLTLAHPVGIQGGAYFTKIEYNKKPLYIQTIKSQSRQGFVKTGKKYYVDLMFDKNAESLIHWFENLEEKCQKLIFEKRDSWFQNSLEENDIETAFSSTIRVYKSGKFYLVRTNIKNNANNLPAVKIYNEHQIALNMEDVTSETNVISILEIQGIKFTTRNFQIEIELKQVMVLDNEPLFDNCLIKFNKKPEQITEQGQNQKQKHILEEIEDNEGTDENNLIIEQNKSDEEKFERFNLEKDKMEEAEPQINNTLEELEPIDIMIETETPNKSNINEDSISLDFEELNEDVDDNPNELKEINKFEFSLGNNLETMQLKKPNQVYFELYKEARNKAKIAKKNALLAYLEAKKIKKTYMIENLNDSDSDSDIDDEIDEVSDSELEGL